MGKLPEIKYIYLSHLYLIIGTIGKLPEKKCLILYNYV